MEEIQECYGGASGSGGYLVWAIRRYPRQLAGRRNELALGTLLVWHDGAETRVFIGYRAGGAAEVGSARGSDCEGRGQHGFRLG